MVNRRLWMFPRIMFLGQKQKSKQERITFPCLWIFTTPGNGGAMERVIPTYINSSCRWQVLLPKEKKERYMIQRICRLVSEPLSLCRKRTASELLFILN